MAEFWEENFIDKQEMWGLKPAISALWAKDDFIKQKIQNVLIPGIGYGRNARPFIENGIAVTGIEISQIAIRLARKHYGTEIAIYHGSACNMPFDNKKYDGIFCYALIHLLDKHKRRKLIRDCYNQLKDNGYMIFTAVTKEAPDFGKGKHISTDRHERHKGVKIFYYDKESVEAEFGAFGLFEIKSVNENQPMYLIKCHRK